MTRWARGGVVQALAAVAAATAVAWVMVPALDAAPLVMVYLLAIVVIAARYGRGPSVVASLGSVAAFDFFFIPPYFTFAVAEMSYLLTFAVMLFVGLLTGGLTARIRHQAEAATRREARTAALLAMSRELAQTGGTEELVAVARRHLAEVFDAEVVVLLTDPTGRLEVRGGTPGVSLDAAELASAREALETRRDPGLAPRRRVGCLPLVGHRGPLGVVVLRPRRARALATPEEARQLQTFVNQTALALERAGLADEAREARVRAETERLRNALLTSVSHDLRTPLAAITGAATTLLDAGSRLAPQTHRELIESIRDEAERLNRLVQNLLQMTRLEAGALRLDRDWHSLEELIGAALRRLARALGDRKVVVNVPSDLPLVAVDDVLIEQVLVNLLDNAVRHTPPDTPVRIVATATDDRATVEVADHGPGLPPGAESRVFDKFYRAGAREGQGAGLGLAICRGIVEAHGGRIWAQNLPEGGVAFLFTLPLGAPPSPSGAAGG